MYFIIVVTLLIVRLPFPGVVIFCAPYSLGTAHERHIYIWQFLFFNPFGTDVAGTPIFAVQAVHVNTAARRGTDKLVIADINPRMRYARFVGRKKDQIAGNEIPLGDGRSQTVLLVGHARQSNAAVGEDVLGKTRAVKTVRRVAAEYIGNAKVLISLRNDFIAEDVMLDIALTGLAFAVILDSDSFFLVFPPETAFFSAFGIAFPVKSL